MERTEGKNKKDINGPVIDVGILTSGKITVKLNGEFRNSESEEVFTGKYNFSSSDFSGELKLIPVGKNCSFIVENVIIGKKFHWERHENQEFKGIIKIIPENGQITVINCIHLEDYLKSVISSEMSANAHLESLKAHAVISRSWLMSQLKGKSKPVLTSVPLCNETEIIKWFDREAHDNYDVCAGDHCQRYQGITKVHTPQALLAVETTCGMVLTFEGSICDARYSKCCGGISETYEKVWENQSRPYLIAIHDSDKTEIPGHDSEKEVKDWIDNETHGAFCNVKDDKLLETILNDYDAETSDFFRWKVEYTQDEISELVKEHTGVDFGKITDMIPMERGVSGRLVRLKIVGDKCTMTIGKELFIRQALSPSHLYSSAFYVEKNYDGAVLKFILHGAGWGHGVGLCQIGAASMAEKGYSFDEIIHHYYPVSSIEKVY